MEEALAHKIGMEDYYSDTGISDGLSEETVVFYGDIPPKYLRLLWKDKNEWTKYENKKHSYTKKGRRWRQGLSFSFSKNRNGVNNNKSQPYGQVPPGNSSPAQPRPYQQHLSLGQIEDLRSLEDQDNAKGDDTV